MHIYREYKPYPHLSHIIECLWVLQCDYALHACSYERIWPDIRTELIIHWGSPYYIADSPKLHKMPPCFLIGPYKRELLLHSKGNTSLVAIRFQPWGITSLLKYKIEKIVNSVSDAAFSITEDFTALHKIIIQLPTEGQLHLIQDFLYAQLAKSGNIKARSSEIINYIYKMNGNVSIKEILAKFNCGSRKLERIFLEETGLTAKTVVRLVRFNYARRLIARKPSEKLTKVAYACGYADQAHFIRNFKELFGITPSRYQKDVLSIQKENG